MKRRTTRLAALGLSAFFIAGTVSFPVHASEVPEDSGSSVFASKNNSSEEPKADIPESEETEESEDTPAVVQEQVEVSEEPGVEQVAEPSSEQATEEQQSETQQTESVVSVGDIEESPSEASTETRLSTSAREQVNPQDFNFDDAAATIDNAVSATGDAKDAAVSASEQTDNAVVVINNEETTSDEASLVIENAQATVDEARATFDQAETNYNDALDAYNQAVSAYNAILDEYNTQKDMTAAEIQEAEAALTEAMDAVDDLEAELKARKAELVEAGATGLLSIRNGANGGRGGTNALAIDKYISTVVEYYYIPETEKISDGQSVSNFCMYDSDDDGYVTVEYDVVDEDGETLRTGAAEYKYEIDDETGEIKISTREKVFHYTNKDGEEVYISKDDAERLSPDNLIEIDNYYSLSGSFALRYVSHLMFNRDYQGNEEDYRTIDPITIQDGKDYWKNVYTSYENGEVFSNVFVNFVSGTKRYNGNTISVESKYDVFYNVAGEHFFIPERYTDRHYNSEAEAVATLDEYVAVRGDGAIVDYLASRDILKIEQQHVYSEVVSEYENRAFSDSLTEMINSYYRLLGTVNVAKTRMLTANNRLTTLRAQMSTIEDNYTEIVNTSAVVTSFEISLEKAENSYVEASDNLVTAEEKLEEAKTAFEERFGITEEELSILEPAEEEEPEEIEEVEEVPIQAQPEESGEPEVVEEIEEELEEIEDEAVPTSFLGSTSHSSGADYGIAEMADEIIQEMENPSLEQPTPAPVVPKPQEEKPEKITVKGILERGKWFVGLAGVSSAGAGVAAFEAKRRAAIKLLDKLNQ
ncbi:hypothetical protein [Pseudobutyrivibrio sp.]|jgi:hypothetical protein|uniref:hypothetical protein n=1 Tax=Pseudobutyrivibrio sp. TaxID=2014367 RepID=UPI0025D84B79|nr:hypothetical protein [Pseudobutyrivibrio sp.]